MGKWQSRLCNLPKTILTDHLQNGNLNPSSLTLVPVRLINILSIDPQTLSVDVIVNTWGFSGHMVSLAKSTLAQLAIFQ